MIQVEREREVIQSLSPADQMRMAMHALNGWTFSMHAAGMWIGHKVRYFDNYGNPLERCLDAIDRAMPREHFDNEEMPL